jgi:hypothetical protein
MKAVTAALLVIAIALFAVAGAVHELARNGRYVPLETGSLDTQTGEWCSMGKVPYQPSGCFPRAGK